MSWSAKQSSSGKAKQSCSISRVVEGAPELHHNQRNESLLLGLDPLQMQLMSGLGPRSIIRRENKNGKGKNSEISKGLSFLFFNGLDPLLKLLHHGYKDVSTVFAQI